jgi:hypothetical protein
MDLGIVVEQGCLWICINSKARVYVPNTAPPPSPHAEEQLAHFHEIHLSGFHRLTCAQFMVRMIVVVEE